MRGGPAAGARGPGIVRRRVEGLYQKYRADFPPTMTAADEESLRQVCLLFARAQSTTVDADTAVRCAGTGHRILASIRRRYRTGPALLAGPSLYERLEAEQRAREPLEAAETQSREDGASRPLEDGGDDGIR
jgi:hypothetical protein